MASVIFGQNKYYNLVYKLFNRIMNISPYTRLIQRGALFVIAAAMCSCASTGTKSEISSANLPTGKTLSGWYQAGNNPPTYYPRGFPADSSTTHRDGDWVYAGEHDEQWFIPKNGARGKSSSELNHELLTLKRRTQNYDDNNISSLRNKVADQSVVSVVHKSAVSVVISPLVLMGAMLQSGDNEAAQLVENFGDFWYE